MTIVITLMFCHPKTNVCRLVSELEPLYVELDGNDEVESNRVSLMDFVDDYSIINFPLNLAVRV